MFVEDLDQKVKGRLTDIVKIDINNLIEEERACQLSNYPFVKSNSITNIKQDLTRSVKDNDRKYL
jgi:hypothetical protein